MRSWALSGSANVGMIVWSRSDPQSNAWRGNLGARICVDRQKNRNQHQETSRVACWDWSKAAYVKTKKNVVVMRNDSAILGRAYVHANMPVKQKAFYTNWTKLWSVLQITYIHNHFCSRYDTAQCTEKGRGGGEGKGVRWVWLWGKYPAFKFHSEVRSIFQGNIAPTPRGSFHHWDVSSTPKM